MPTSEVGNQIENEASQLACNKFKTELNTPQRSQLQSL